MRCRSTGLPRTARDGIGYSRSGRAWSDGSPPGCPASRSSPPRTPPTSICTPGRRRLASSRRPARSTGGVGSACASSPRHTTAWGSTRPAGRSIPRWRRSPRCTGRRPSAFGCSTSAGSTDRAGIDGAEALTGGRGPPSHGSVEEGAARRAPAIDEAVHRVDVGLDEGEEIRVARAALWCGHRFVVLALAGLRVGAALAVVLGGVVGELPGLPTLVALDDAGDRLGGRLADGGLALRGDLVRREVTRVVTAPRRGAGAVDLVVVAVDEALDRIEEVGPCRGIQTRRATRVDVARVAGDRVVLPLQSAAA